VSGFLVLWSAFVLVLLSVQQSNPMELRLKGGLAGVQGLSWEFAMGRSHDTDEEIG